MTREQWRFYFALYYQDGSNAHANLVTLNKGAEFADACCKEEDKRFPEYELPYRGAQPASSTEP